jgi:hypothetical protein
MVEEEIGYKEELQAQNLERDERATWDRLTEFTRS